MIGDGADKGTERSAHQSARPRIVGCAIGATHPVVNTKPMDTSAIAFVKLLFIVFLAFFFYIVIVC